MLHFHSQSVQSHAEPQGPQRDAGNVQFFSASFAPLREINLHSSSCPIPDFFAPLLLDGSTQEGSTAKEPRRKEEPAEIGRIWALHAMLVDGPVGMPAAHRRPFSTRPWRQSHIPSSPVAPSLRRFATRSLRCCSPRTPSWPTLPYGNNHAKPAKITLTNIEQHDTVCVMFHRRPSSPPAPSSTPPSAGVR